MGLKILIGMEVPALVKSGAHGGVVHMLVEYVNGLAAQGGIIRHEDTLSG